MTHMTEHANRKDAAMGRPAITDDQRELAVILLANALRKDAHLRPLPGAVVREGTGGVSGALRWRVEASRRYAQGMFDLLAVLFDNGRAVAEECLADAETMAFGRHDD
jgi:hypothetical protein